MKTLRVLSALFLFGGAFSVAGVYILMWFTGNVAVCEPTIWVRALELGVAAFVSLFGLFMLVREVHG